MKEIRTFYVPNAKEQLELPAEEAAHAVRVLRLNYGDEIVLIDGQGSVIMPSSQNVTRKDAYIKLRIV